MDTNDDSASIENIPADQVDIEQPSDSESDFGSFGSFDQEETEAGTNDPATPTPDYYDPKQREVHIKNALDAMFEREASLKNHDSTETTTKPLELLLSDRSNELYSRLADIPRLRPPNWTRLVVRHRLLISLGIPVNLDEITTAPTSQELLLERRKSVQAADIDWTGLNLPEYNDLKLDESSRNHYIETTQELVDRMEAENMNHSSLQYLESALVEDLKIKLEQYKSNVQELRTVASVWKHELETLQKDSEIYESVVQNLIGHSQRLRRDEILQRNKKK